MEKEDKRLAWFPAPYLRAFQEDAHEDEDEEDLEDALLEGVLRALHCSEIHQTRETHNVCVCRARSSTIQPYHHVSV